LRQNEDQTVIETFFPVRYAETDAMGVVHHASYLVYFEEGRSQFMRDLGSDYAEIEASGFRLPVSEIGARYISSVSYGQHVTIRTWLKEKRSRAVTFNYEVLASDCNEILVTGFTSHIWTDSKGKVTKAPEMWQKLFSPKD
jgi:acyl-CoA thioester hydrolase